MNDKQRAYAMMTKAEKNALNKEMSIAKLLVNNLYTEDSGMVTNLRRALRKLSRSDLGNLLLIVRQRELDTLARNAKQPILTCPHCEISWNPLSEDPPLRECPICGWRRTDPDPVQEN